jgi:hypothetical protein
MTLCDAAIAKKMHIRASTETVPNAVNAALLMCVNPRLTQHSAHNTAHTGNQFVQTFNAAQNI